MGTFIDHIYQPLRSDRIWHKVNFQANTFIDSTHMKL